MTRFLYILSISRRVAFVKVPLHFPWRQNHVLDLSKSKIVSATCRKAKACPQPAEKQKRYHNPQKPNASMSSLKHKNGFLHPRGVMTPERRNPIKQGLQNLSIYSCFKFLVTRKDDTEHIIDKWVESSVYPFRGLSVISSSFHSCRPFRRSQNTHK